MEDYLDQLAVETEDVIQTIVEAPESYEMEIAAAEDKTNDKGSKVPDELAELEDQIAMESLNKHLKKITQLSTGLKQAVESDLIRKLTTVEPKPKSKCLWLNVRTIPSTCKHQLLLLIFSFSRKYWTYQRAGRYFHQA